MAYKLKILLSRMKPGVKYNSEYAGDGNVTKEIVDGWIDVCESREVGRNTQFNWVNMMNICNDVYRDIMSGK